MPRLPDDYLNFIISSCPSCKKEAKIAENFSLFIFIFMLGVCDFLLYLRQIYVVPDDDVHGTFSEEITIGHAKGDK